MDLEKHKDKIKKLRKIGETYATISLKIKGTKWWNIRDFCKAQGIESKAGEEHFAARKNVSPLEEIREEIAAKWEEKESLKDIAAWLKKQHKLDYTEQRISQFCRSRGMSKRGKRGGKKAVFPANQDSEIEEESKTSTPPPSSLKTQPDPLLKEPDTKPKIRKKKPSPENLIEDFTSQPFKIKSRKQR